MSAARWFAILPLVLLAACANTKGSWACRPDRGAPCQSIASLDHTSSAPAPGEAPSLGGAPVRWWSRGEAVAGAFDAAPRREPDQVVRVLIAGWTDSSGDYHAPSEVFAIVRRGGWWAPPAVTPLAPARPARAVANPTPDQPAAATPLPASGAPTAAAAPTAGDSP